MLGAGVQRNTITYDAAISACEKGGQWQQGLELFERMRGECVQRDTITYGVAISACEKGEEMAKFAVNSNSNSVRIILVPMAEVVAPCG